MAKPSITVPVILSLFVATVAAAPIEEKDVHDAQKAWADGIVNIGKRHSNGESRDYIRAVADELLDGLYAYKNVGADARVLLRMSPIADKAGFGLTRDDAFQYFFGQDSANQEVRGFALRPWNAVRFENVGILLQGDAAMAMGRCMLTDRDGAETVTEFTFGYIRDNTGAVRITLHHMSTPTAATTLATKVSSMSNSAEGSKDSSTSATGALLKKDTAESSQKDSISATSAVLKKDTAESSTAATTTVSAPSTTAAANHHNHVLHKDEKIGRPTKAPSESNGSDLWAWISLCFQILAVVSILSSLFVVHSISQMKSRPGMSLFDKILGAVGMSNMSTSHKVKRPTDSMFETDCDKHV